MPAFAAPPFPSPARFLHVGTYAPLGQALYSFAIGADGGLTCCSRPAAGISMR